MLTQLAAVAGAIFTLAGNGTAAGVHDGAPATRAGLQLFAPVAALPDGGFLVGQDAQVWRVDRQGLIHAAAGTGTFGLTGDGGPALRAQISVTDIAALPGGGFLFSDSAYGRVRMVDADGTITTVAGGGSGGANGIPARAAMLRDPGAVAALPGGGFLVADNGVRVRRVGPDGRIATVAGSGADDVHPPALHGQPATSVTIDAIDLAATPGGGFLIADDAGRRVERVAPDGAITVAASAPGFAPDAVAVTPDGFLAGDARHPRVWRAGAGGTLTPLAGDGPFIRTAPLGLQQRLSGEPALGARLGVLSGLAVMPDGGVLVSAGEGDIAEAGGLVRYVAPEQPAVLGAALLRGGGRVLGAHNAVDVSLTEPASVRLSVAGRSVDAQLGAGVSRVALPEVPATRPQRLELEADGPDGTRAFDALRLFPPRWLPAEAAQLVAEGVRRRVLPHVAKDRYGLDPCRRVSAARLACRITAGPRCADALVAYAGARLRWAAALCHRRARVHLRRLRRSDWSCVTGDRLCPPPLFGRVGEADLVPSR